MINVDELIERLKIIEQYLLDVSNGEDAEYEYAEGIHHTITALREHQARITKLESERQAIEASAAETRGERDRLLLVLEIREQHITELEQRYGDDEIATAVNVTLQQRIVELELENKMLHRSLASKPDTATSSGAAQAVMQYEIEKREQRIAKLEALFKTISDAPITKLAVENKRLDAALAQAILTANEDREDAFHLEYCPHGAEWGQCTLCPLARSGK